MNGHEKTAKLIALLLPATEAGKVDWEDPSTRGYGDLFRCPLEKGLLQIEHHRVFVFTYPNAGVAYIYQPETDQEKQQLGDLYELVQYQMSGGPEILDHMLQEIKDLGV
jgi:hypothetical protein